MYDYRVGDENQSIAVGNQVKQLGHVKTTIDRMLQLYCQLPDRADKHFIARKTQAVGTMYLTAALLAHPDKKAGRQPVAR